MLPAFQNYNALQSIQAGEAGARRRTLADIGQYAAKGDFRGAQNAAFSGGDIDAGMALKQMNDQQKAQLVDEAASWAYQANSPEAWEQGRQAWLQKGFDPGEFGQREVLLSQALSVKDRIAQAQQDRQFGLQEREFGANQAYRQQQLAQAATTDDMREYQFAVSRGYKGSFEEWLTRADAGAQETLGLNLVYGKGPNGPVAFQPGNRGTLKQVQVPEGVTLLDPYGKAFEGALGRELGKSNAEANVKLPGAATMVDRVRTDIDRIKTFGASKDAEGRVIGRPTMGQFVGKFKGTVPNQLPQFMQSQERVNFNALVDKAKSDTFSVAYETVKGAGAVTELETTSAARALANMDTAQDEAQFNQALDDFQRAIEAGYAKIAAQSQMGDPRAAQAPQPQQQGPRPGDIEDGHRFKGGNPADPNSWEKVN